MSAVGLLGEIAGVGRGRGGYSRHVFDRAEGELRAWFAERAERIGLDVETDRNGNLWAWWGTPGPDALVTGSHLDSVPGGGAFDGPLGVVSALDAVAALQAEGFRPGKPLAVLVFAEEEGGRFGVPCLGSRLLTGSIDAGKARALRDQDGVTFAEAAARAGFDPERFGRDEVALSRIGTFLELHVEQGRGLVDLGSPVAVGSTVIAHGRWRFSFSGQGNHAGATLMGDRHDPMVPAAAVVAAARRIASKVEGARATVGRLIPRPGGTNVIASTVDLWLDARVTGEDRVRPLVDEIADAAGKAAAEEGCEIRLSEESYGGTVAFDAGLREELRALLGGAPELPTGAGHDAAILSGHTRAGMLYVRNPTGISHAPEEFAEDEDVEHGARALAEALRHLST
ncbi:allantoate amidohydrolase [Amycolatopsis alkalitolerans]|uniref:Allantoate amidohydrolase n=1 Tax=Amycolatopsis alkalitolerans TaxID=2547244 RepID=A0A5C4LUD3_9PSEU|nr:allantoate amidohydrolase [Amycolatopsis alkalitolerans]TNC21437.1 allantoate amidohydrolase [Amycolatopsis alkalitolerans]